MTYNYNITTDIISSKINIARLSDEINNSPINATVSNIRTDGNTLTVEFESSVDEIQLTALVANHSGEPYIESTAPTEVKIIEEVARAPFASKVLPSGQKLFKRIHGVQYTVAANTTQSISFTVPYIQAKIDGLQILGASLGDTANFKVYDNNLGTISGVPDIMLNQFGFGVCLSKDFHVEESQYDADVIQGMKLELEFTNSTDSSVVIGANFILHEVV